MHHYIANVADYLFTVSRTCTSVWFATAKQKITTKLKKVTIVEMREWRHIDIKECSRHEKNCDDEIIVRIDASSM